MFLNRVLTLGLAIYKQKKKKSIAKAKVIPKEWIALMGSVNEFCPF